jgi:cytochrome c oxidase cbb3-type subunit 1
MASMTPYYFMRFIAGLIFLAGTLLMAYNLFMTMKGRQTVTVFAPAVDPAFELKR